jgi:SAM-dependent methyltransferase
MSRKGTGWFHHLDDRFWLLDGPMPPEQARFIKRALRLRTGQRVLDVPCGAGRTSLAMANLGLDVTGVELRSKFVNRAKRRFRRNGLSATFLVGDMRELDYEDEFHAVVNWFGSFGYFDDATNLDVLRRFTRAVRPGGRVLIQQANRERCLRHFLKERRVPLREVGRRGGDIVMIRNRWNPELERVEATWTLDVDGQRDSHWLSMRWYTPGQFKTLFKRAGLEFEALYGSALGEPYTPASPAIVVVGRKPKQRGTDR